ncbi:MAG: hypothetical protein AMXMBFR59_21520 [Rhodanobacteraceae bacterium]
MPYHYRFAGFELDPPSRALLSAGTPVAIEPKVFDVLSYLVEHRERAVGRDELIAAVWGRVDVADATLQQAISRLRRVLHDTPETPFVRTVPRHGYQWVAPTRRLQGAAEDAPSETAPTPSDSAGDPPELITPPASPGPRRRFIVAVLAAILGIAIALGLGVFQRLRDPADATPPEPAATRAAATTTRETAGELGQDCAPAWPAGDCIDHLTKALSGTSTDRAGRARLLLQRAQQHLRTANTAAAAADLDDADAHLDGASHPGLAARALYLRHRLATLGARPDDALAFGQRALAIYRELGASDAHAELLHSLGSAAGRQGELERALAWLDAARTMFEQVDNAESTSRVLATTAYTLSQLGRFKESLEVARQALTHAKTHGSAEAIRDALIAVAWASIQNGRLSDAREAVHEALRMLPADGNPQQAVSLRALLGFIDAAGGRFQEALDAWNEALAHTSGAPQNASIAGLRLAVVYAALNLGDRQRAQAQSDQLQAMAGTAPEFRQSALHATALLALADGDDDTAAQRFAEVWSAARDSGSLNQQMLADYADVLLRRGDLDTLETLLGEPSLPAREGHLYFLVQARYLAHRGRHTDALAAFDQARALAGERYTRWLDVARREVMAIASAR